MMRMSAKPIRSMGVKIAPVHADRGNRRGHRFDRAEHRRAHRPDAHDARHIEPERDECADDHGEHEQPPSARIERRYMRPWPYERREDEAGEQERDAVDDEIAVFRK